MEDKIVIALIAAVAALVGGLISSVLSPLITHRLQQSSAAKERKRALIARWREMIHDIHRRSRGDQNVKDMIRVHPDFLTLEPHLSDKTIAELRSGAITVLVGGGDTLAHPLKLISADISRLERAWKLL